MIADIDIWRAAHLMVKRHGEDAAIEAAQRADELLASVSAASPCTGPKVCTGTVKRLLSIAATPASRPATSASTSAWV